MNLVNGSQLRETSIYESYHDIPKAIAPTILKSHPSTFRHHKVSCRLVSFQAKY